MTPTWNAKDEEWTCEIALPAWRSFLPTEQVEVVFDAAHPSSDAPPLEAEVNTVLHLIDAQEEIRVAVETAVRAYYDQVRPKYVAFAARAPHFMGDPATSMPENPEPAVFARLHELGGVFVQPVIARGLAYLGFSCDATWEPEHGLGVVTHDRRVIEVSHADAAFTPWTAVRDAGRLEEGRAPTERVVKGRKHLLALGWTEQREGDLLLWKRPDGGIFTFDEAARHVRAVP